MPNYEYKCTSCEHVFEVWQGVGEAAPQCPECGSEVRKVFHPPRVIFKGSGFYVTDLRAEKEGKAAGKNSTAEATPAGESTESKPESKPEPAAAPAAAPAAGKTASAPAAAASDK